MSDISARALRKAADEVLGTEVRMALGDYGRRLAVVERHMAQMIALLEGVRGVMRELHQRVEKLEQASTGAVHVSDEL